MLFETIFIAYLGISVLLAALICLRIESSPVGLEFIDRFYLVEGED